MAAAAKAKKPPKTAKTVKKAKEKASSESAVFKTVKFGDYTISAKRSGRYYVVGKGGTPVNGPEKSKILVDSKLVKLDAPQAKKEEAVPA